MEFEDDEYLNQRYSILSSSMSNRLRSYAVVPTAYYPAPDDAEYKLGSINRVFVKNISSQNSYVIEVSEGQLFTLRQNIFYSVVMIKWTITGPKYMVEDGDISSMGAYELNDRQRRMANKQLPGVFDKLPDPLQFYRLT